MPVTDTNRAARRRANMLRSTLEVAQKIATAVAIVVVVAGVLLGAGMYLATRATAKAMQRIKAVPQPMLVSELSSEQLVQLVETYDPNFYTHNGISSRAPQLTTITQRLVQQYYFDEYQGWLEWLPTCFDAWALNRVMSKDNQLRLFINTVPLGISREQEVHGFEEAAKMYFDEKFTDLNRDGYLQVLAMIDDPDRYHIQTEAMANIDRANRLKRFLDGKCKRAGVFDDELKNCEK